MEGLGLKLCLGKFSASLSGSELGSTFSYAFAGYYVVVLLAFSPFLSL